MTQELIEYLAKFQSISNAEKKTIQENIEVVNFKSGEVFIESGHIANKVGFILSGVFRFFFYDREGNEITSFFMREGDFVTSITSFFEHSPSSGTIQAETDCEVILISRDAWDFFSETIANWSSIFNQITNQVLLKKANFQRELINQDAKTSYLRFMQEYPTVVQRVPSIHIASYLGITKFSLSRIRKQITSE